MLCSEIYKYIETSKGLPFFYVVGDKEYICVLEELKQNGLEVIKTSDFCHKDDKFPDIDDVIDHFRTLDIDFKSNKFLLVGLGEYLALRGSEEAKQTLRRLKNTTLGNARVVLLLRGISAQMREILNEDVRLVAKNLVYISQDTAFNITVTNYKVDNGKSHERGIKHLIRALEDGTSGNICMNSELPLDESSIPITVIDKAYTALCKAYKYLSWVEQYGINEQWSSLLDDFNANPDEVLKRFSTYANYEQDIYEHVAGLEYKNWLYFLNLKLNVDRIQNIYLSYVVSVTNSFMELKDNILIEITKIPHDHDKFKELNMYRKALVKNFPESDIAIFVNENKIDQAEEIYKYTDNTLMERRQIIRWVAKNGWNDVVAEVYPALGMYLKKYIFSCGNISVELTRYFERYKLLKIENRIDDEFMELVYDYGKSFKYTKLQTRDNAVNKIENKNSTYLYWIDALGVEYLSYITELAKSKGLSIHVDVARADLPTITSVNRLFYEKWSGVKKYKEEELDDIKHKKKGGFFYTKCEDPIHLASELDIIKKAIETAATSLALHECKTFVIASDHGASRLAVIKKDEKPHPSDTQGEHSGRCCKSYEESENDFVIEENGFFVRSDYGRYKGSRVANVEVHGGASLEEIAIPIITLKLRKQADINIRVLNAEKLLADRHKGTLVELYVSDVDHINNVYIVANGNKYIAKSKDATHYDVLLDDIKRAKECSAEVYDGEDLIGNIKLVIKGKTASINSEFDEIF